MYECVSLLDGSSGSFVTFAAFLSLFYSINFKILVRKLKYNYC